MIIDFHTHLFPDALAPRALAQLVQNLHENNRKPDPHAPYTQGTAESLTASARRAGIGLCVVMPIATSPHPTRTINDFAALIDRTPGLRSFGSVHPDSPDALAELERLALLGLKGIKLHPEYQECFADAPNTVAVVRRAAELGLWVLFHAGEDFGKPPPVHGTPEHFVRLRDAVPDARIILAHMGALKQWEQAENLYAGGDFYVDTSYSVAVCPEEWERFARCIRRLGTDHVLFGSDSPWANQDFTLRRVRTFLSEYQFTEAETAAMLGGNAARILQRP